MCIVYVPGNVGCSLKYPLCEGRANIFFLGSLLKSQNNTFYRTIKNNKYGRYDPYLKLNNYVTRIMKLYDLLNKHVFTKIRFKPFKNIILSNKKLLRCY